MPISKLPGLGFAELFTHPEFLEKTIKTYAEEHLNSLGEATIEWDDKELKRCISNFRANCFGYYSDILASEPSQLKYLGYLLFCLTQEEDQEGIRTCCVYATDFKFHNDVRLSIKSPERAERVIQEFSNEMMMFMAVFHILNRMQEIRPENKRYDTDEPPMHYRYLRAMIDYLRPQQNDKLDYQKTPFDLYIILKTMDLFGMDCSYD